MTGRSNQAGFTLIELMLASILGGILLLSAFGILYDSIGFADVMRTRAAMNAAARESFGLLLNGGLSGTDPQVGVRGFSSAPSGTDLREAGKFRIKLQPDTGATEIYTAQIPDTAITCAANDDPIPFCDTAGTLTVNGYLGDLPVLYGTDPITPHGARSIASRTSELQIRLFSAYNLNRPNTTTDQAVEVYRTIFTLNVD